MKTVYQTFARRSRTAANGGGGGEGRGEKLQWICLDYLIDWAVTGFRVQLDHSKRCNRSFLAWEFIPLAFH
jgi:hypothetical protein